MSDQINAGITVGLCVPLCKRTQLTFQPGVTALIGKNDSGKTAIIDAVGSVANFGVRRIHGFGLTCPPKGPSL